MNNVHDAVQQRLLNSSNLTDIEAALASFGNTKLDYGDIYLQEKEYESWALEDSKVKSGNYSIERGLGIRAIIGEKTGFAYADEISPKAIKDATATAKQISRQGQSKIINLNPIKTKIIYSSNNPIDGLNTAAKINLLHQIDRHLRRNTSVVQVFASLVAVHEYVLIAATDGTFNSDIRPLVRLNISVIVEKNGQREQGGTGMGGRYNLGELTFNKVSKFADAALRLALINLEAKPAPAGAMDVVLAAGWPGVLLHEAVGHGLEADFIRKQTSVFAGRLGEKVASGLCTVVDDGTIKHRRGSLQMDDEGIPTQSNTLIENGILVGFMQDTLNARLMKTSVTGNGRRESYAHLPMPRMTNTFMLNGKSSQAEMIAKIKNGIFAVNFAGGQVDITSGQFVFTTSEAYKVDNGKITYPIKNATLIGNGPEVMRKIAMVGNDMQLDDGVGTCGKSGQSVPVGVGQPSLLVNELVVGGTDNG